MSSTRSNKNKNKKAPLPLREGWQRLPLTGWVGQTDPLTSAQRGQSLSEFPDPRSPRRELAREAQADDAHAVFR